MQIPTRTTVKETAKPGFYATFTAKAYIIAEMFMMFK